jgi:hypothetical protein
LGLKQHELRQAQVQVAAVQSGCSCGWSGLTAAVDCGRATAAAALAAWGPSMAHRQQTMLLLPLLLLLLLGSHSCRLGP